MFVQFVCVCESGRGKGRKEKEKKGETEGEREGGRERERERASCVISQAIEDILYSQYLSVSFCLLAVVGVKYLNTCTQWGAAVVEWSCCHGYLTIVPNTCILVLLDMKANQTKHG